uniref:Uncharacterized protein n=1 Tax=Plectus sambesii TaxID=2011161 RepID=A0A914W5T5_9BILA
MASLPLSTSDLLSNSKKILDLAKLLLTKANRNALHLQQASEQLTVDVQNVQFHLNKIVSDFSLVLERHLQGDVSQTFSQFSSLFQAYEFLRDAFRILRSTHTDQHFISQLNGRFSYLLIDSMQNKLIYWLNSLVMQLGVNGNSQTLPMKTVLDIFHKCVDHIANGPLENWRREQKRSMLGIKVKPNEITETVQLLQLAQKGFKYLMRIWHQLYQAFAGSADLTLKSKTAADCKAELQHLLQSSFIIEWSMCGCGERKQHNRQTGNNAFCRTKFQPPAVISRGAAVDEDKVTVMPKLLAVSEEDCQKFGITFDLLFVRPADVDTTTVNEKEALSLRNGKKGASAAVIRGGRINGVNELKSEEAKFLADGSIGHSFTNLSLTFDGDKRSAPSDNSDNQPSPGGKGRTDKRRAETKYHMLVTAKVNFFGSDETVELKTISTPFMISVNAPQFSQVYRAMLWSILASAPDSVTFAEDENAFVIWGDMSEAIKWIFYTLTVSRELRDGEVDHIGYQIFKLNNTSYKGSEFIPSRLMKLTREDIHTNRPSDSNANAPRDNDAIFTFWEWFYSAIEMVDDRNNKILPTKMATTDPDKKDWRTMAGLFSQGVIFGFIGRDEVSRILNSLPFNAALLRISDHFCYGLTIACRRKSETSVNPVIELVPLNHQMLTSGLPQLLAKLTQLDGIEAIVSWNPHHGLLSVAKRDLIGPVGPTTRRNGVQEYGYSNPVISVVGNTQPQKSALSDDDLRNMALSLGPDNGAKLATMLRDLFLSSRNSPVVTPAPYNQTTFNQPDVPHLPSSPLNYAPPPPCQYQQSQQSNQYLDNYGNGQSSSSSGSFDTYRQQTEYQNIQNQSPSSSNNVPNNTQSYHPYQSGGYQTTNQWNNQAGQPGQSTIQNGYPGSTTLQSGYPGPSTIQNGYPGSSTIQNQPPNYPAQNGYQTRL